MDLRAPRGLSGRQPVVLELLPKREFLNLTCCSVWNFLDEDHVVRNPPLRRLSLHEAKYLFLGGGLTLLEHDHKQWPLVPFRMRDADDCGFHDLRMADREIFKVDR